jgi:hypothetical protein
MRGDSPALRAAWTRFFEAAEKDGKIRSPTALDRYFALGRKKKGERNKTEAAFEQHLENQKRAGVVLDYGFQRITLHIPGGLNYTPDFDYIAVDNVLTLVEVKPGFDERKKDGSVKRRAFSTEDSAIRLKVCASIFPLKFIRVFPDGRGDWAEEEF